jgi:hypothetical protein
MIAPKPGHAAPPSSARPYTLAYSPRNPSFQTEEENILLDFSAYQRLSFFLSLSRKKPGKKK